jgi:UDP-2-acetamido-3-amino-2,3-dideoxy-glucuronate N-acetyltransferase
MVGHVLEYHPGVQRLHQLVSEGALGRIQYIYSHRLNLGRIRTEENVLWSFAPHDVALLLRLLGTMPEEVICHGKAYLNSEIADVTLTILHFPNQVQAHIFVSWLHPFKEHRFVVVGDKQMAVFDDTKPWSEKLILYPHRIDWIKGQIPVAHTAEAVSVSLEEKEPLRVECEHFLECILTRKRPLTDGESALKVIKILDAAHKSLKQGGRVISLREEKQEPRYFVHPTATIDPGAEIGEGTKIWHYSHIMNGAKIGKNCVLGQNVFIGRNVKIGDNVKIQNNVSVYEGVELEDYVFCGPSMVFTNVINPRSEIERKNEFRRTLVRRGATLGANCTIICGVTIGKYAFVGAGAVVTKDVPDYALVVGVPARLVGWICECGYKLSFERFQAICSYCGKKYRKISEMQIERIE